MPTNALQIKHFYFNWVTNGYIFLLFVIILIADDLSHETLRKPNFVPHETACCCSGKHRDDSVEVIEELQRQIVKLQKQLPLKGNNIIT